MINLIYVILIAMLAINISSDTLDAYSLFNENSVLRVRELKKYNKALYDEALARISDPKTRNRLEFVSGRTDKLMQQVESLKTEIAQIADNAKFESVETMQAKEDLNAVPRTMLSVIKPGGHQLRTEIEAFRDTLRNLAGSDYSRDIVSAYLNTRSESSLISWEKKTFSNMPAIGGIAFLNNLEENILLASSEICRSITARPPQPQQVESKIDSSRYVLINRHQQIVDKDGTINVPIVKMSLHWEDVLYADFENQLDLLAIGINPNDLRISATNASVSHKGENCRIMPDEHAQKVVVTISCNKDGKTKILETKHFGVHPFPTPAPYLLYAQGNARMKYTGNVPISREKLQHCILIGASLDSPVPMDFKAIRFEMILIKADTREVRTVAGTGETPTKEQRQLLASAQKGDKLYISSIEIRKANGKTQQLPSISALIY